MRKNHLYGLLCATLFTCRIAAAQTEVGPREHFARGLKFAQSGELDAAAEEFEEAYRVRPNYMVQYNLGQAYFALGRSVPALAAFEEYLRLGGSNLAQERRRDVERLIAMIKKRVGSLRMSVELYGTEVLVDGRSVGKSPLTEAILLPVGVHGVTASLSGYFPFITTVTIEPEKVTDLPIALSALPEPPRAAKLGQIEIACDVPATIVTLDDTTLVPASAYRLIVPVGTHRVAWERDGYSRSVAVGQAVEGSLRRLVCDLRPLSNLSFSRAGVLTFLPSEPDAKLFIDGHQSHRTARLPSGPHAVLVRRSGFEDWTNIVVASPGLPQIVQVGLRPTVEHTRDLQAAAHSRRRWAYAIGGAGLALIGTAAGLYVNNTSRYADWRRDREALKQRFENVSDANDLSQRAVEVRTKAVSIQRQDDWALGAGVVGGGLLGGAFFSWLAAKP